MGVERAHASESVRRRDGARRLFDDYLFVETETETDYKKS
jgi:hypothetical protein